MGNGNEAEAKEAPAEVSALAKGGPVKFAELYWWPVSDYDIGLWCGHRRVRTIYTFGGVL